MAGALPDAFDLEWHPTRSVLADVDEGEWQVLSGAIRELDCEGGYQRDVGRVEAGRLVAVVDNRSRALDPTNRQSAYWPNLGPLRHLRAVAYSGVTKYVIWRGFITGFDPDWSIDDAWVTIQGYDSLMAAAAVISESILADAIDASNPDIWLPLNDGGSPVSAGRGRSPLAIANATVDTESILPFANTRSTSFPFPGASRSDVAVPAGTYQVNQAACTVMGIFKSERTDLAQIILAAGPTPPAAATPVGDVALVVDAAGTYSFRVGNAGGSSVVQFPQPHNDTSTLVFGTWDRTAALIGLEANQGYGTIGGNSIPAGTIFNPRAGAVRIGAGLDTANAFPFVGSLSHVALWNRLLGVAERTTIYRGFWGLVRWDLAGGVTFAQDVITWVLDQLGIAATRRDLAVGAIRMGGTPTDLAAIAMMSRAANTEGGYFHADRTGKYIFRLRGHKGSYRGTYDTDPPAGSANRGLLGLSFAVDTRSFFTTATMQVTLTSKDPIEVPYRHPNAAIRGDVPYEPLTQFQSGYDAHDAGVAAVGSATPRTDIVEAVVAVGAAGVSLDDLLASTILDEADVVARPPDDAGPGPFMTWDTKSPARWPQIRSNTRNDFTGRVGVKFTAPAQMPLATAPPTILALGRMVVAGNNQVHTLEVWRVSTGALLATVAVPTVGKPAGEYTYVALGAPLVLTPGEAYYVVSTETNAGDLWYNDESGTGVYSATGNLDEAIANPASVTSVASAGAGPWVEPGPNRRGFQNVGWLAGSSLTGGSAFWSFVAKDSVTRADSAVSAGSTEGGTDVTGAYPWVPSGPSAWGVAANRLYRTGATGQEQLVLDTGATDHEVEARLYPAAGDFMGLVTRWVDVNNHYLLQVDPTAGLTLYAKVAGVYTGLLAVLAPGAVGSGELWRLRSVGTSIVIFRNGVLLTTVVDASLAAGTRGGLNQHNTTGSLSRFDDVRVASYPALGWAGPDPVVQRSTILYVGHNYSRLSHAWRTRWGLTPS